ncbi:hypothetical protein HDU98_002423, partial [Podochytrium sp. JEL0797]
MDIQTIVTTRQAGPNVKAYCLHMYYFGGLKKSSLAELFCKHPSTIASWIAQYDAGHGLERQKSLVRVFRKYTEEKRSWLVDLYKKKPTLFQDEAKRAFEMHFKMQISLSSVSTILREANMSWKTLERRAIQIYHHDVIRFSNELNAVNWLLSSLVFLDEVGFDNRDMLRTKGYCLR